jgi:hypothetical protein
MWLSAVAIALALAYPDFPPGVDSRDIPPSEYSLVVRSFSDQGVRLKQESIKRCVELRLLKDSVGDYSFVTECELTLSSEDTRSVSLRWGRPMSQRSVSTISPTLKNPGGIRAVPLRLDFFAPTTVFFISPPEKWDVNDPLVYTNTASSTVVVLLNQYLIVN